MISRGQLIKKYLDFFKKKKHKEIPSASLIPENDPTVLFVTAGMHPLVPYLLGQKHPLGKRLVSNQKCIRTTDIEEVGDTSHHTFFEMLGNWSLGDYWKEEAISKSYEFLTKELKIKKEKLAVSIFKGDKDASKDTESEKIWQKLGIQKERIVYLGKEDNWWGPAGKTGPCGPDTEMFYWTGKKPAPKKFNPEDKNWVEIWNDVFMEYNKKERIILVDWINCLYALERGINKELFNILKNQKFIILTNAKKSEIIAQILNSDLEGSRFFTLEGHVKKNNPEFFRKLFDEYKLKPNDVIYFDHKDENVKSAESLGIKSVLYKGNNQIKKFIEDNLYAFIPLKQKNVDTGMGVERTLAILNNLDDNYQTEVWKPIINKIEELSGKKYKGNEKAMRIIADHTKASVFILGDEKAIKPSNTEHGYVLRRLIRRAVIYGKKLGIQNNFTAKLVDSVISIYPDYSELKKNRNFILTQLDEEENKFRHTLEAGIREFDRLTKDKKSLTGKEAFLLYQSYGFPIELTKELAYENKIEINLGEYQREYQKHQELSRTQSAGTFRSGLADSSEKTTKLHTATHLLNESLRKVLGNEVKQRGSNITSERLRFDFNFSRKLTDKEIRKVESLVNDKILAGLKVIREEMPYKKAIQAGAQAEFGQKYPERVSVYTIFDDKEKRGWFSKELCTGPHVKNTKDIGRFKIIKEESSSAGIRRIKAIVE